MKTNNSSCKMYFLAVSALIWCAVNICAQTAPTITTQPISQTNLSGTAVTFSVAVNGTGPFTYQWQFNGTNLPGNIISTVAGNGTGGFGGDGGKATSAILNFPSGVAFDGFGDMFIVDSGNSRIRMVNTNGIITTVAGKSTSGFSGDGGAATSASLNGPDRVAFDTHGNFYITDTQNQRIRKVATNGIITTVAGNGTTNYSGDGALATSASLHNPVGVTLNAAGKLYFADDGNSRIRMVNTNGIITTVAGNGTNSYSGDGGAATNAGLYYPNGIAFDTTGNLHIADASNQRIRKLATNGIITTVAGNGIGGYTGDGGQATNAEFGSPRDVAFDTLGNLYVADYYYGRIRKVATNGIITTVAGNGTTGSGAYSGDGGAATNASFSGSTAVAFDAAGNLYIADSNNQRIRKVLLYAEYPSLTLTHLVPTNAGNYSVVVTSPYGSVTSVVATLTVVIPPPSLTIQPVSQTNLVGTAASFSVGVSGTGPFTYQWQFNGTNLPNNLITTVAGNGNAGSTGDGGLATNARLNNPPGVAVDAFGNLYIADDGNSRIRKVDTNGIITTVAGNGSPSFSGDGGTATNASLMTPSDVNLDSLGNLYISDWSSERIRKVDTNGIITTVAGNGSIGNSGNGGAATNASFNSPSGVAFDTTGNMYIADLNNYVIRKVDTNGIVTVFAGAALSYPNAVNLGFPIWFVTHERRGWFS